MKLADLLFLGVIGIVMLSIGIGSSDWSLASHLEVLPGDYSWGHGLGDAAVSFSDLRPTGLISMQSPE